ncbi:Derlin [Balamuthia mandrillaris]
METFEDWYRSMPVITRTYMTACFLTTMAVQLDFISPLALYLNFGAITHHFEIWRLLTTFLFFDYFNLNFVFHMFFTIQHSKRLEEGSFRGRTGDYFFFLLFGAVGLLSTQWVLHMAGLGSKIPFLAPSLAFMIVYVWSRRNRNVQMSFLGLFTFTAPYLPWVILGFGLLLGHSPLYDLLGLAFGHLYYFLEDVYPSITERRLLRTPAIIKYLFDQQQ